MSIKKEAFYEGAALHQILTSLSRVTVSYQSPFFVLNSAQRIYFKYSAAGQSPWGFTFSAEEQSSLRDDYDEPVILGLICGSDGVVTVPLELFDVIAGQRDASVAISCQRRFRKHYEVSGPDGRADRKIAPSEWQNLLLS